jgi:DNA (cytosine-5)-methyltransferase 1
MRAIDLYAGAGGASMGLHQVGFEVWGVDISPQPRYPFPSRFVRGDVLSLTAEFIASFDFVWSSPPCQFHSAMKALHNAKPHVNLIPRTRALLIAAGRPYVIENVEGARGHLVDPFMLCDTSFGLGAANRELQRHRLFETSFPVTAPSCGHSGRPVLGVYGGHVRDRRRPTGKNHVSGLNRSGLIGGCFV